MKTMILDGQHGNHLPTITRRQRTGKASMSPTFVTMTGVGFGMAGTATVTATLKMSEPFEQGR